MNHRQVFEQKCEEFLNSIPIENELEHVEISKGRAKMELIGKDVTFSLQEEKIKSEGETKGKVGCEQKTMKRLALEHWSFVAKKKEGNQDSNLKTSKRKK